MKNQINNQNKNKGTDAAGTPKQKFEATPNNKQTGDGKTSFPIGDRDMKNSKSQTHDDLQPGYEISPRFPYKIGIYVRGNSDREIRAKAQRIRAEIEQREERTSTGSVVAVFSDRKESWFHRDSSGRLSLGWEALYDSVMAGKVNLVAMEDLKEIAANSERMALLSSVITFFGCDILVAGKNKRLQFRFGPESIKGTAEAA